MKAYITKISSWGGDIITGVFHSQELAEKYNELHKRTGSDSNEIEIWDIEGIDK